MLFVFFVFLVVYNFNFLLSREQLSTNKGNVYTVTKQPLTREDKVQTPRRQGPQVFNEKIIYFFVQATFPELNVLFSHQKCAKIHF